MNLRTFFGAISCAIISISCVFAHGRSQEMIDMLNAPPPEWLTIGKPTIAVPPNNPDTHIDFHKPSGGATNTRNRIQIPDRGIEIRVDYPIDWTGDNASGRGVSLSPNGTELIVNSGTNSRLYEILPDGTYKEVEIALPHVTYDPGEKGFITGWRWVGDKVLLGKSSINDFEGHEVLENRLYVFHLEEKILSRLDLSSLGQPDTEGLEVLGVGNDLHQLKIAIKGKEFTITADLQTPPAPMKSGVTDSGSYRPAKLPPAAVPNSGESSSQDAQHRVSTWILWLAVAISFAGIVVYLRSSRQKLE